MMKVLSAKHTKCVDCGEAAVVHPTKGCEATPEDVVESESQAMQESTDRWFKRRKGD